MADEVEIFIVLNQSHGETLFQGQEDLLLAIKAIRDPSIVQVTHAPREIRIVQASNRQDSLIGYCASLNVPVCTLCGTKDLVWFVTPSGQTLGSLAHSKTSRSMEIPRNWVLPECQRCHRWVLSPEQKAKLRQREHETLYRLMDFG